MAENAEALETAQHQSQVGGSISKVSVPHPPVLRAKMNLSQQTAKSTSTITVNIVSAEEEIFSGQAKFVVLPGVVGELGVLPGHAPLMTSIRPGVVRVEIENGDEVLVFVAGGILEIQPNVVTVLADTAIRGQDLDEAKAQQSQRQAEEALQNASSNFEYAIAQSELANATAQLLAIQHFRRRRH